MTVSRAAILARARKEGRRAGLKHRLRGTIPVPPASTTDGSLLMRQVASEWHRGVAEGRRGARQGDG